MVKKYVKLVRHQIEELDKESFDLEAWKKAVVIMLGRIFGDATTKINELEKIKFDYGSWSLRDASGSNDQMDSCKIQGRVVLEACIAELEILGLEEDGNDSQKKTSPLIESIEEELKMSEYKELIKILKTKSNREEKKKMLVQKLQSFETLITPNIVANLMTHPAYKKIFI